MHQNENPTGNASSTSGCPWTLFKLFTFMITFTFVIFSYTGIPEPCHLYEIMAKGDFTGCFSFVKCLQSWSCPVRLSYFKCLQSLSCPVRLSYYKCKTRRSTTPLQQSLDMILDLIKLVMVECKTSVTSIDAADEDMVEKSWLLRDKHTGDLVYKPLNTDICQRIVMDHNENPTGNAFSISGWPWTLFKLFTFMIV